MSKFLVALLCFTTISTASLACPNIDGNYACVSQSKNFKFAITQNNETKFIVLNADEEAEVFAADNSRVPMGFSESGGYAFRTATCNGKSFSTFMKIMEVGKEGTKNNILIRNYEKTGEKSLTYTNSMIIKIVVNGKAMPSLSNSETAKCVKTN